MHVNKGNTFRSRERLVVQWFFGSITSICNKTRPKHIYLDNGTNFVGANNQLREIYAMLNSKEHKDLITKFSSERRIAWHFIPPVVPHFGGLSGIYG